MKDKKFCVVYIKKSEARKIYRMIKHNQASCLKPSIDMNTDLRKKRFLFKLINARFGKKIKSVRKNCEIKVLLKVNEEENI